MDAIFSEDKTNYTLYAKRGCIRTAEEGIKEATVIEKYLEYGGGMWSQPQYILQERVVVSTSLPLYLNPVSIEKSYQTSYIRRYKVGSRTSSLTGNVSLVSSLPVLEFVFALQLLQEWPPAYSFCK